MTPVSSKDEVMKCVEGGLDAVLGQDGKAAIAFHLANRGISIADSFDRPALFAEAVRTIFGVGSAVLEGRFVECLRRHFQLGSKVASFPDTVTRIKGSSKWLT
jgi:hypothetical protein